MAAGAGVHLISCAGTILCWSSAEAAGPTPAKSNVLARIIESGVFMLTSLDCPGAAAEPQCTPELLSDYRNGAGEPRHSTRLAAAIYHGDCCSQAAKGVPSYGPRGLQLVDSKHFGSFEDPFCQD